MDVHCSLKHYGAGDPATVQKVWIIATNGRFYNY